MKRFALLLSLLMAAVAYGQEQLSLSKMPSKEQLQSAKEVIKSAETSPTKLSIGGYATVDIKLEGKLTPYIVPGSDDCIKTVTVIKATGYEGWLVTKGENEFRWTKIDPVATHDRIMVTGVKQGVATLIWIAVQNNEAVVVAAFRFEIGPVKPAPVIIPPDEPVIPVEDELTKRLRAAAQLDAAAGKADKKHLLPLAGIYLAASNDPLAQVSTMDALDTLLFEARKRAGIPDPAIVFPNLRKAVQQEIYARLGIGPNDGKQPLTDDTKRLAKLAFGKIATTLEILAK